MSDPLLPARYYETEDGSLILQVLESIEGRERWRNATSDDLDYKMGPRPSCYSPSFDHEMSCIPSRGRPLELSLSVADRERMEIARAHLAVYEAHLALSTAQDRLDKLQALPRFARLMDLGPKQR
jgi:hypothetical protein